MHSFHLESYSKTDFLKLFKSISDVYIADAFYSGDGFDGEDKSYIFISPDSVLSVNSETDISEIRQFAFSDERITTGFLSYDYGLDLKDISSDKDRYMEEGRLCKYSAHIIHDGGLTIGSTNEQIFEKLIFLAESVMEEDYTQAYADISSNMTAEDYISKVEKTLEYIRDGETYQLNLSMMFEAEIDVDIVSLWCYLAEEYPAPFYSFMNSDNGQIISSSPERFLKVTDGNVLTQPIKGTYIFDEYEDGIESNLTDSPKESAELSMIVDLMRNDISEVCTVGSVIVQEHKSVFKVDKLLQMYSSIIGELEADKDVIDLLIRCFPGGSITGCPKRRSMEIIDELEPHSRGIYCGSMFIIEDEINMDSSIGIRTGFYDGSNLKFFAGSGIVIGSVPDKEYLETMGKADKFFKVFKR